MLSRLERAKQFLPFDALSGLQDALRQKEQEVEEKMELDDEQKEEISYKLQELCPGESVVISYYDVNHYNTIRGKVIYVNPLRKVINISKIEIPFYNIESIKTI